MKISEAFVLTKKYGMLAIVSFEPGGMQHFVQSVTF